MDMKDKAELEITFEIRENEKTHRHSSRTTIKLSDLNNEELFTSMAAGLMKEFLRDAKNAMEPLANS